MPKLKKPSARKTPRKHSPKKWSADVTEQRHAMDLRANIFIKSPKAIAAALKRSAEESRTRKASPFQSAMSMLNFYINRAGHNLSAAQHKKLESAKNELRQAFDR